MRTSARSVLAATVTAFLLVVCTWPATADDGAASDVGELRTRLLLGEVAVPVQSLLTADADGSEAVAAAAGPLMWSRSAFQSYRDGNWEIYFNWPDSTHYTRITNNPAIDARPRLNRGCDRLLFESNRDGDYEIYVAGTDGSGLQRLTTSPSQEHYPDWSPDESRIVFSSNRDGNYQIYTMNPDGSGQARLITSTSDDTMPAYSADGQWLAWVRVSADGLTSRLMVAAADGSLAHSVSSPLPFLGHPVWNPDGSSLMFDYDADGDVFNELALIDADGSHLRTLLNPATGYTDYWAGAWSPDGDGFCLFTSVTYGLSNGELVVTATTQAYTPFSGGPYLTDPWKGAMPDWETLDASAPVVTVTPLPAWTQTPFTLHWSATDSGGSGFKWFDVQVSVGGGAWSPWIEHTQETSAVYYGEAGSEVRFRVRGVDNAWNSGAWHEQGDVSTRTYVLSAGGTVRDTRGRVVPGATVVASEGLLAGGIAGPTGVYTAYSGSYGQTTLQATHAGYGASPLVYVNPPGDVAVDHYVTPVDNVVVNGDMEDGGLTAWQPFGSPAPQPAISGQHSGGQALVLGAVPGFTEPVVAAEAMWPTLLADKGGVIHLVASRSVVKGGARTPASIVYTRKTGSGPWQPPTTLLTTDLFPDDITVAADGQGGFHMAWVGTASASAQYWGTLTYCRKYAGVASCTSPTTLATGAARPRMAVDSQGGVHLVVEHGNKIEYRYLPRGGVFGPPVALGTNGINSGIAVDGADSVHVMFLQMDSGGVNGQIKYTAKASGGAWSTAESVVASNIYHPETIAVASDGTVYIGWSAGSGQATCVSKPPSGVWSLPERIGPRPGASDEALCLLADKAGGMHAVFVGPNGESAVGLQHWVKGAEQPWAPAGFMPLGRPVWYSAALNASGDPVFTWRVSDSDWNLRVVEVSRAATEMQSGVSQRLTIGADANLPTASLLVRTTAGAGGMLAVSITDDVTTTRVATVTTGGGDWRQLWADVSAWAGRSVTLTLSLVQGAGETSSQVMVDEVSLGSWSTPVVATVTPREVGRSTPTEVTLTGENLLETPTVRLGEVEVPVVWVDAHTVRITVPAGLRGGYHDVRVTNPGGQETVLQGALRVGLAVYLPIARR